MVENPTYNLVANQEHPTFKRITEFNDDVLALEPTEEKLHTPNGQNHLSLVANSSHPTAKRTKAFNKIVLTTDAACEPNPYHPLRVPTTSNGSGKHRNRAPVVIRNHLELTVDESHPVAERAKAFNKMVLEKTP